MIISKKVADILLAAAERYLASLPEEERNQILSRAANNCVRSTTEQTTSKD
ncbi:hypothetical protein NIES4071_33520 [Calothrix sp. NIES-4071]|nr:hypothetical protein NIES4071_33520 [Calothrix sp. NIES-4071]BAZ57671.1 hypothetical protein NIES4105_33450 [Calothrix sp. NIES-4105]